MAEDLAQLHEIAAACLAALEARARTRLLRRMSGDIRRVQQRRMAAQRAPDGSSWPERKPRRTAKPATRPVRFLYPSGGSGPPRLVDMRSWRQQGQMMVGFDREADGLRTFKKSRVIRWLPPEGQAETSIEASGARGVRGKVRQTSEPMFRGLRSSRWLKAGADTESAWVEFTSRASRFARVHHYGERDQVAPDGPEIDYPQRKLIGFAPSDEALLLNAFIDHAGDALGWGRRAGR